MSEKRKRYILPEEEIPHYWYNIQADMVNKPMPPLHPGTKQPLKAEDLYPIFAKELCHQELNQTDAWIEIPEEVREMYKYYRSTPLVRAYGLEKALGTPAHIYFKNESVSPIGSHKLNSALAQAYYCKEEGVTNITTETGAGQWGAALSYAAKVFGLEAAVYQVKISYEQKQNKTMKKFVFTLLLVFVCHLGYAQSINGLFNEFGSEKNADCVKVSSFMMSLGKMFAGHDEDAEIIRKIKSIKVLDLESCTASVKERFSKKVNRLSLKGYDELMRVNDEGEKVRVLMKTKKETIRELLFVCTGKEDCTLVQINGKFTKEDIDKLVNQETKKKHGRR